MIEENDQQNSPKDLLCNEKKQKEYYVVEAQVRGISQCM